jgi:hypothetical protein
MRKALIHCLFFISGVSALIYELVWQRLAWQWRLTAVLAWQQIPAAGFYKSLPRPGAECLLYQESNNATVSVLEDAAQRKWLLVDGQPVAGTGRTIMSDQKMLAHLPLLLHPAPHRALTVGFGSGGTSHSMSLHDIDVDCVEIESAVPAAAPLAYVGPDDLNTDDRPILSYTTYGATFRSTVATNLAGLMAARAAPAQFVLQNYAASNEILLGHVAHQLGNESEALRHYAACTGLLPGDKSIRELVLTAYRHIH